MGAGFKIIIPRLPRFLKPFILPLNSFFKFKTILKPKVASFCYNYSASFDPINIQMGCPSWIPNASSRPDLKGHRTGS